MPVTPPRLLLPCVGGAILLMALACGAGTEPLDAELGTPTATPCGRISVPIEATNPNTSGSRSLDLVDLQTGQDVASVRVGPGQTHRETVTFRGQGTTRLGLSATGGPDGVRARPSEITVDVPAPRLLIQVDSRPLETRPEGPPVRLARVRLEGDCWPTGGAGLILTTDEGTLSQQRGGVSNDEDGPFYRTWDAEHRSWKTHRGSRPATAEALTYAALRDGVDWRIEGLGPGEHTLRARLIGQGHGPFTFPVRLTVPEAAGAPITP